MFSKYNLMYILTPLTLLDFVKASENLMICYNSSLEGFRFRKKVLMHKIVSQKIDCIMECATEPCCRSVNYKNTSVPLKNETNCEMLHNIANPHSFDDMLEVNPSFDYVHLINPHKEYNKSCFFNITVSHPDGPGLTSCNSTKLMKKGCYKDAGGNKRTFPTLLKSYPPLGDTDWNEGWHDYLYSVTCHCGNLAKNAGHRHFGVQDFKECWAGELSPEFFNNTAKAEGCWGVRPNFKECLDHTDTKCVGDAYLNYIYEIISG